MAAIDADDGATLVETEQAARNLRAELVALREQSAALTAQSTVARRDITDYGRRHSGLVQEREAVGDRRRDAGDQVGRITKRQLSEIKHLLRSPPDAIRRTLIAAWLLLHSQRFKGKLGVSFDEAKDWPRCQRMLADENFIAHILNFNTTALCETPHVLWHVAWHFFGIASGGGSSGNDASSPCSRANSKNTGGTNSDEMDLCPSRPPVALNMTVQSRLLPALPGKNDSPMRRRSATSAAPARASLGHGSPMRRTKTEQAPKPPLDVEMVSHASEPCGALLLWMLELVREYADEERLRRELQFTEAALKEAEAKLQRLEEEIERVEAETEKKRKLAEEQERLLQKLKAEEAKREALTQKAVITPRRKAPVPEKPPAVTESLKIAVELCGSMAHVEKDMANQKVPFDRGEVQVLCGNVEQALALPKLAELIKQGKGSLKVLIEGHCESGEKEGTDLERSLAVYEWLVQAAAVPPAMLRIKGCGHSQGMGCYAIPVPIHEVATPCGPVPSEIQAASARARPGLYFHEASATLGLETRAICSAMAKFLCDEDDVVVRIEGHTDRDERDELGMQRAMSVREVLVGLGVKSSRLKPTNCKHLHPLNRVEGCLNRRVELHEL